jgi:ADP-ribosylglycohydrolase
MKNPNSLMLLRIGQGDAYGHAVEYIKFPRDQHVYDKALLFNGYGKHPTHNLKPGQYTDDTQMSIAVAEVLIAEKALCMDLPTGAMSYMDNFKRMHQAFADSFVGCFKRDPRDGYARGFQAFLEGVVDGQDFLARINPDSDKNGAAMRSVPLGVLPDPELVYYVAGEQAKLTHHTSGGTGASMLVGLMSHFALYQDSPLSQVREFVSKFFGVGIRDLLILWPGGPVVGPGVGMATARAVMTLISTETTLLGIARKAIEWGGDVDSVLSIAWGIASARMDGAELPPFFEGGLEDGAYGRDFLRDLGAKLMETYSTESKAPTEDP